MQTALILGLVYLIAMPIVLRLVALAHKKLVTERKMAKAGKNRAALANMPKPLWAVWKERLSFTFKDKRTFQLGKPKQGAEPPAGPNNRTVLLMIWGAGGLLFMAPAFVPIWWLSLIGVVVFFFAAGFAVTVSKPILEARKKVITRMFDVAKARLGQSATHESAPEVVVKVLEWEDYTKPKKVAFEIPTSFSMEGEEGFLRLYNQVFGQVYAWVPSDDPQAGENGWDYGEGKLTLRTVPPLPEKAPWDEHYVLGDGIAWSFFPIALGVENGVELPNPKTGEIENVLGFDLSGEQVGEGKKHGLKVSGTITTSPMCVVGSTQVMTADGVFPISELAEKYENGEQIFVKSFDISTGEIVERNMFGIGVTRESAPVVSVIFDTGESVTCTADHPFLTSDGEWVAAESLTDPGIVLEGSGLKAVKIISSGFENVYNGEVEETHNYGIIFTNESYIWGHNCLVAGGTGGGKSVSSNEFVRVKK